MSKIKYLTADERKGFKKEYKEMIDMGFIIRQKKKTGKGSDWHITLNPKRVDEILEMAI